MATHKIYQPTSVILLLFTISMRIYQVLRFSWFTANKLAILPMINLVKTILFIEPDVQDKQPVLPTYGLNSKV